MSAFPIVNFTYSTVKRLVSDENALDMNNSDKIAFNWS